MHAASRWSRTLVSRPSLSSSFPPSHQGLPRPLHGLLEQHTHLRLLERRLGSTHSFFLSRPSPTHLTTHEQTLPSLIASRCTLLSSPLSSLTS